MYHYDEFRLRSRHRLYDHEHVSTFSVRRMSDRVDVKHDHYVQSFRRVFDVIEYDHVRTRLFSRRMHDYEHEHEHQHMYEQLSRR